jgi:hypothetical protein
MASSGGRTRDLGFRCDICGRGFGADPIYPYVQALPEPSSVARQVVAYHSVRLRFQEEGCPAVGMSHLEVPDLR